MKVKLLSCEHVVKSVDKEESKRHRKKSEIGKKIREERTHVVDSDFNRNDITGLVSSFGIVILTESHNINTLGTKGRPNGRSGCSLASFKSQLYHSNHCTERSQKFTRKGIGELGYEKKTEAHPTFLSLPAGFRGSHCYNIESPTNWQESGKSASFIHQRQRCISGVER